MARAGPGEKRTSLNVVRQPPYCVEIISILCGREMVEISLSFGRVGVVVVIVDDYNRRGRWLGLCAEHDDWRVVGVWHWVVACAVNRAHVSAGGERGRRRGMRVDRHLDKLRGWRRGGTSRRHGASRHGVQAVAVAVQAGSFAGEAGVSVLNGVAARRGWRERGRGRRGGGCLLVGSRKLLQHMVLGTHDGASTGGQRSGSSVCPGARFGRDRWQVQAAAGAAGPAL
jgi:hypothetical protein